MRRYLTARFEPGEGELVLRRGGTLAELDVPVEGDLLRSAFLAELSRRGVPRAGGTLEVSSQIPVGRGLGTSAAALVGGLLLGSAAAGEHPLDAAALLDEAGRLEGHGDNAAPAVHGGLVGVVARPGGGLRALSLPLSPEVAFAFAAPELQISTAAAREAMPAEYTRRTAVAALGRLASLLHGLAEGDGDALALGLEDELHVPYRLPLIPGGAAALQAAREAGAWGATLSGSGSGLLGVCPPGRLEAVMAAMSGALRAAGHEAVMAFPLEPERRGAQVLSAGTSPAEQGGDGA